jgi:hypothetical protein
MSLPRMLYLWRRCGDALPSSGRPAKDGRRESFAQAHGQNEQGVWIRSWFRRLISCRLDVTCVSSLPICRAGDSELQDQTVEKLDTELWLRITRFAHSKQSCDCLPPASREVTRRGLLLRVVDLQSFPLYGGKATDAFSRPCPRRHRLFFPSAICGGGYLFVFVATETSSRERRVGGVGTGRDSFGSTDVSSSLFAEYPPSHPLSSLPRHGWRDRDLASTFLMMHIPSPGMNFFSAHPSLASACVRKRAIP